MDQEVVTRRRSQGAERAKRFYEARIDAGKLRLNDWIVPAAAARLCQLCQASGLSRSEVLERLLLGQPIKTGALDSAAG